MTTQPERDPLRDAVESFRGAADAARFPLELPSTEPARRARGELVAQLDDYVLPRLRDMEAPLLAVVGGSTGAGKSTLVNSLIGQEVSPPGVLRPTTRASVLVFHPEDEKWFSSERVLPGLARVTGSEGAADPGTVRLVPTRHLRPGMALLDAPDIDSVVRENRDLARQLLAAADLWVFVTTAARYADAVPWELLREAGERGTAVAIILDRTPVPAVDAVRSHLGQMLQEQRLGSSPMFVITETRLTAEGLLPEHEIERLRSWLGALARDARARGLVIRRTLAGALDSLDHRARGLAGELQAQEAAVQELGHAITDARRRAVEGMAEGMSDGTLLRGEVLARWQELVGTGEFLRQIEAGVSRLRDRITATLRGSTIRTEPLGEALQSGAAQLMSAHARAAVAQVARTWRQLPAGERLVETSPQVAELPHDLNAAIERRVRDWQGEVLEMVRQEAGHRRATARYLALGVNGIGVLLILFAFSMTGGLTGVEGGIAVGSAVVAQRILEAVFGDQAVRTMAAKAKSMLLDHAKELFDEVLAPSTEALAMVSVDPSIATRLIEAAEAVRTAR